MRNVTPLISCIVPNFNYARYLPEALDSILAQTYLPIEILIVDAGSTDDSAEVAARYADRVRYMLRPTRHPSETRNAGIAEAHGEFIAFLDSDDLWKPEKLALQMARFTARPDLDFCLTHAQIFWDEALQAEAQRLEQHPRAQSIPGYATTTLLARRTLFDRVGLLDPALRSTDAAEWIVRALEQGAVMEILPEMLVFRRIHQNNLTRKDVAGQRREWLHFVKARLDRQRGGPPPDMPGFALPRFDEDA
jgi:glycosyltransferase involved in cell wall biosynthesis